MSFQKVSVLVPTRGRVDRLSTLVESWENTVQNPSQAELIFRIDDDDRETWTYLQQHPYSVRIGPRLLGYRSLPAFFDELRSAATGDLFLTGNDDMIFRTPNWPLAILDVANAHPDGIFCLGVQTHNAKVFPFAIVSRIGTDMIGHIHDPRLYWGDVYLRDVYAAFGRAIRVPQVRIDHDWAGHAPDQTFLDAQQQESRNWDQAYWTLHGACVQEAVARLRAKGAVAA